MSYIVFDKENLVPLYATDTKPDNRLSVINVSTEFVKQIFLGNDLLIKYIIQYNDITNKFDLVIKDNKSQNYDFKEFLIDIISYDKNPELNITQDLKEKQWILELNGNKLERFFDENVLLKDFIFFSVTEKNNPNILYRLLKINLTQFLKTKYLIIPFIYNTEQTVNISIFAKKNFLSTNFKRIDEK